MSYISAIRIGDDVIVWERTKEGRDFQTFRAPYYFYVRPDDIEDFNGGDSEIKLHSSGSAKTFKGEEVLRFDFATAKEFQIARQELIGVGVPLFESDIPPEIRILSQHYYGVPTPSLNVTFYDIEVDFDIVNGHSTIDNPYAPINSVALFHRWQKRYVVIAVQPEFKYTYGYAPQEFIDRLNEISPLPKDVDIDIIFAKNEEKLLQYFLEEIKDTDLMSGWNSDAFDMPYVGKRCELYGKDSKKREFFRKLSFDNALEPVYREYVGRTGQVTTTLDLSGRISSDMMLLFIKYEQYGRQSYKLESISDEVLVDDNDNPVLPKLEYEGSLADLYKKDFAWFVRYNLRDTEILEGLEQRLGYTQLAIEMYHMSTGVYKHVNGTIKLSELSVVNYCHHVLGGLVVNDITKPEVDKQIKGALVLLPQVGEHEYVGSIDINSLYPSAIRSLNISPETLRGQFVSEEFAAKEIAAGTDTPLVLLTEGVDEYDGKELPASEWKKILKERKWAVSGFGTVFDQNKQGIIPAILEDWFKTRKHYQKLMIEAKENHDYEKVGYYDRLQYTYKIKLNAFYGALSNLYFRFYDLRMGESTTGTGRAIVLHQCRKVAEVLEGNYDVNFPQYSSVEEKDKDGNLVDPKTALDGPVFNGMFQSEAVIYGDTDSTYFETKAESKGEAIQVANAVAKKVNESYQKFMQDNFLCVPGFDNIIKCGRELVTGRGIFVDKKRYILHILDKDGKTPDKPSDEIKVMGLDTKKTTLPKPVSKKLNNFVERYLKGENWDTIATDIVDYKEQILTTKDVMSIGLPKGVKGVDEYTEAYKLDKETALPGHVAASIFYNKCRESFKDNRSMQIRTGMKIKVFYLSQKYGRFKSIAIPVDIEEVPSWFFDNFSVDREAHLERLVDNPLENIIKAIGKEVPSKQSLLVDSLLEF
jgi:DNA polymerase elongation subunit (family B)